MTAALMGMIRIRILEIHRVANQTKGYKIERIINILSSSFLVVDAEIFCGPTQETFLITFHGIMVFSGFLVVHEFLPLFLTDWI